MGRAAERPPLARFWRRPRLRGLAVAALGAAFEAGVSLVFGPAGLDDLHLAVALGILTACNTVAGAGKDVQKAGEKVEDAADKDN